MMQIDTAIRVLEQIHDGKTHVGEYLNLLLTNCPVSILWKNRDSVTLGCNTFLSKIVGFSDPQEIIGKTDFDLNLPKVEAELFIADDQDVLLNKRPRFNDIRTAHFGRGMSVVENVTKFPTYNHTDEPNGTICIFHITSLTSTVMSSKICDIVNFHSFDISYYFKNKCHYYIIINGNTFRLSTRQAECLTYLSIGKTIKQIANLLDCATSTIEDHLSYLKRKLGVYTTSALIDCFWANPIRWF